MEPPFDSCLPTSAPPRLRAGPIGAAPSLRRCRYHFGRHVQNQLGSLRIVRRVADRVLHLPEPPGRVQFHGQLGRVARGDDHLVRIGRSAAAPGPLFGENQPSIAGIGHGKERLENAPRGVVIHTISAGELVTADFLKRMAEITEGRNVVLK